jgi:surface antigen
MKFWSYSLIALAAVLTGGSTLAQNTMFLRNSPIAHLDEQDREILRETIEEVLESPDGTVLDWSNPDTGSHGRVKVLDTHEDLGTICRNLRARNQARSRQADGIYRLCKAADGSWKFASAKAPTSSENAANNQDAEEAP